jgi:dienelactone hydrolase
VRRWAAAVLVLGLAGCSGLPRPIAGTLHRPPAGDRPGAPVVVWGGSTPGEPRGDLARRLAAAGHPTLSLAYYGAPGLPRELESIPLEYFARAIRTFDRVPGVDGRRLVVYGVSRGSEAALLVGAHFPRLVHGVIAVAPSSKVNPAVPRRAPSWTLRGRPLPIALADDAKGGFDAPAVIPVERIRAPILLAAGTRDRVWDSLAYERAIVRRRHRRHAPEPVTAIVYRGAGHGLTWRADLFAATLRFLDGVGR